jgi:hypothetical protein
MTAIQSATPRSRRALLAAAVGGIGALIASALGRPTGTRAAAGDGLIIGSSNDASTSQTVLLSGAGGAAFTLKDTAAAGTGIFGWSSATSGAGRGLYGRADSPDGFGVQARNNAGSGATGAAIQAIGNNVPAIRATSSAAVAIDASTDNFIAIQGFSSSGTGRGLYGVATGTGIGANYGAVGISFGDNGSGVWGRSNADAGTSEGVFGDAFTPESAGVRGYSTTGVGVHGTSSLNWAGFFDIDCRVQNDFQVGGNQSVAGYLNVGGNLAVSGSKSFRIDHPAAPERRYLIHYSTESNELLNLYSGTVTLDKDGTARVELPDWYDLVNTDARYQLTAIGRPASELHVRTEVAHGSFEIAGGNPGQRVSWQLTARRNDAHAKAHGAPVELDKPDREQGTFLRPELFGHGPERGVPPLHPIPSWEPRRRDDLPAR